MVRRPRPFRTGTKGLREFEPPDQNRRDGRSCLRSLDTDVASLGNQAGQANGDQQKVFSRLSHSQYVPAGPAKPIGGPDLVLY